MRRGAAFYIYLAFIAALAVLSFFIVEPCVTAVLLAAIFAYWFHPLHLKLRKKVRDSFSALILSGVLIVALLSLAQYMLYILIREILKVSSSITSVEEGAFLSEFFARELVSGVTLKSVFDGVIGHLLSIISELIYASPDLLLAFTIFIISFYYFLKEGDKIIDWLRRNIPFPAERRKGLLKQSTDYIAALLRAQLFIGLLQGVVCAIGFFFFGLSDYILIGSLFAAVLSILPVIGPYILYLPVGAFLIMNGNIFNGVGLLVYGIGIGSVLDYVIRPIITAKYSKMHSLVILIGAVGGMYFFGLIGFFIGPVILGLSITIMESIGEGKFFPEESDIL